MGKKIIYLFLALLLPALVFVFLKFFGKNEFDIPVLYQDGVKDAASECRFSAVGQYVVPDSILSTWNWNGSPMLASCSTEKEMADLKQRVEEAGFKVQVIHFDKNDSKLRRCILLMKDPWDAVLIDNQKRIRGYYKLGNRDEMDRLEVELKILLKKY